MPAHPRPTKLVAFLALTGALSGALGAANAQTSFDDIKRDSEALVADIGDYAHDRSDALVEASREALRELDDSVQDVNARVRENWNEMSDSARAKAERELEDLHERRLAVAEHLGALERSSAGAWSDVRTGFTNAFDDLVTSWEQAKRELDPE